MKKMSKLDFWMPLADECPDQMADFSGWIDEYKRRTGWKFTFNPGDLINYDRAQGSDIIRHDPKFHDLPQAMQIGIFIQYTIENGGVIFSPFDQENLTMGSMIDGINRWFYRERLNASRTK